MTCGDFTRNGLTYFTYDALHAKTALAEHADALNQVAERCNINYLHSIYDELKEVNVSTNWLLCSTICYQS